MYPSVVKEIKGIWSQAFKAGKIHGPNEAELYVTMQKSPQQRVKYAAMGKLFEFTKAKKVNENEEIKPFWAPDFCIYSVPQDGRPILVASVDASCDIAWADGCQHALGVAPREAADMFSVYRRQ